MFFASARRRCFGLLHPQKVNNVMASGQISGTGVNRSNKGRICQQARALLERYSEAVSQSLLLHEGQFRAVVRGDADSHGFDALIHEANVGKDNAKYAYLAHVRIHGCETLRDDSSSATEVPATKSVGGE
jgi:hypothetical protein